MTQWDANSTLAEYLKIYLSYYEGRLNLLLAIRRIAVDYGGDELEAKEPLGEQYGDSNKFLLGLAKYAATNGFTTVKQDEAIKKMFLGNHHSKDNRFAISMYINEYDPPFAKSILKAMEGDNLKAFENEYGNGKHPTTAQLENEASLSKYSLGTIGNEFFDSKAVKAAELAFLYGAGATQVINMLLKANMSLDKAQDYFEHMTANKGFLHEKYEELLPMFEEQGGYSFKSPGVSFPGIVHDEAHYLVGAEDDQVSISKHLMKDWAVNTPVPSWVDMPMEQWANSKPWDTKKYEYDQTDLSVYDKVKEFLAEQGTQDFNGIIAGMAGISPEQVSVKLEPAKPVKAGSEDPELEKMGF